MSHPSRRVLTRSALGARTSTDSSVKRAAPVAAAPAAPAKAHRNVRGLGAKRRDKDLYETPQDCALAICTRLEAVLKLGDDPRIIEPSAGSGSFVRAIRAVWPKSMLLAVDLHPENARPLHKAGATSYASGRWQTQDVGGFGADLIVGNPPFSEAEEHIAHALNVVSPAGFVAMLLPASFLSSQGRCRRLWTPQEPGSLIGFGGVRYVFPLAERPSFTDDGATDMSEYLCIVWKRNFTTNPELLPPLWWKHAVEQHKEADNA